MQIIGINGFKRSGKGETANAISSVLAEPGFQFKVTQQVGFADKLKIMAARALGFTDLTDEESIALMDEAKERWWIDMTCPQPSLMNDTRGWATKHISGRQYLQYFGGEARKVFGTDFWVDQVLPRPTTYVPTGTPALANELVLQTRYPQVDVLAITDLRYPNEAERVLALGGEVWEVVRPGLVSDGHDSEQPLPRELVTRQIQNDGNLMDLRYQVEIALATA